MNLAVYEWRKLFRLPALWAFLALCLAFNGLLIASLARRRCAPRSVDRPLVSVQPKIHA